MNKWILADIFKLVKLVTAPHYLRIREDTNTDNDHRLKKSSKKIRSTEYVDEMTACQVILCTEKEIKQKYSPCGEFTLSANNTVIADIPHAIISV